MIEFTDLLFFDYTDAHEDALVVGPKGDTGKTGPQGDTGVQGDTVSREKVAMSICRSYVCNLSIK